jgi:hypothetical protein
MLMIRIQTKTAVSRGFLITKANDSIAARRCLCLTASPYQPARRTSGEEWPGITGHSTIKGGMPPNLGTMV